MISTRNHSHQHSRGWQTPAAACVFALACALAVPAAAQVHGGGAGGDAVGEFIARTGELLQWGAELVGETDSGTARTVLRQAEDLNRRAEQEMGRGRTAQAGNLARRARAALWHAVKLAREAMGLQERLRLRAERFLDLHLQLNERARDAANEEAVELLRRAENQARRAREAHLQGDLRLAEQMFARAEDMTARAARLIAEGGDPERLRAEIERTAELIERARQALHARPDARAANRLGEAEEALDRAREHLAQGEPGRALQMVTLARRLADTAVGDAPAPPEAARRQIERFDQRLAALQDRLGDGAGERVRSLLEQARRHRDRAERAVSGGEAEPALREIRAAHDLLNQAETMLR
ncbi:MAG: hypothetical protein ABR506_06910 [Candidatus Krumholzibacteriia bacterium]